MKVKKNVKKKSPFGVTFSTYASQNHLLVSSTIINTYYCHFLLHPEELIYIFVFEILTLTSRSKLNRSPGSICVEMSDPIFAGTNRGVGGLSMKTSVWQVMSLSSIRSVSSSK